MELRRAKCLAWRRGEPLRFDLSPLQLGMPTVWHTALASMLLCRARRVQAEPVLQRLLALHPGPAEVARAEGLEELLRSCGLQRNRARQIGRFCVQWLGEWRDLRELTGVGSYVADAVSLFCFGCRELTCSDRVLRAYAEGAL